MARTQRRLAIEWRGLADIASAIAGSGTRQPGIEHRAARCSEGLRSLHVILVPYRQEAYRWRRFAREHLEVGTNRGRSIIRPTGDDFFAPRGGSLRPAPGWGVRNPVCRAALLVMGTSFSAPDGTPPITCMSPQTRDMVVKYAVGGSGCGGPPNMLSIPFHTRWVQPGACSGLCGNPANTLFREALHNCGAPDERYNGGYIAERVADIV